MQNCILDIDEGRIIFMCLKFVSELRQQVFAAPEQIQRAILSPEDNTIDELLKRVSDGSLGFQLSVHETAILGTILLDFEFILEKFKEINPENIKKIHEMLFKSYKVELQRINNRLMTRN